MSEKKLDKLVKVLNELPDNSVIRWSVNKSVFSDTIEASEIIIYVSDLASEVGSESLWVIEPSQTGRGWVFGDHKANLTIFLPTTRKLVINEGKAEVVKNSTTYDMSGKGTPVWTVEEINAILASWVYDIVNRSDLVFQYKG